MVTKNNEHWLKEEELRTPIHDEMVLWAFNNPQMFLPKMDIITKFYTQSDYSFDFKNEKASFVGEYKSNYDQEKINKINEDYQIYKSITQNINNKDVIDIEKIIEKPIQGYNGFTLGFIDLAIKITEKIMSFRTNYFYTSLNFDCKNYFIFEELHYSRDPNCLNIFIEIKPEIKSIGEVIRQMQYYKSHCGDGFYFLVTKTKGLKEIFESQRIKIIEYPEDKKEEVKNGENNS